MRVFHYLLCIVGLHARSRRDAQQYGLRLSSVCRGCERPMVKDGNRWRLVPGGKHSARA